MKPSLKPLALLALTLPFFFSYPSQSTVDSTSMASRSFILWLHNLGLSDPANEPIKTLFTSRQFANTRWSFPSAPSQPVTCNRESQSLSNGLILNFMLPSTKKGSQGDVNNPIQSESCCGNNVKTKKNKTANTHSSAPPKFTPHLPANKI